MTVALQIRDVPDDIRDVIAERAAQRGQSMQTYLLEVLRREARIVGNARAFDTTSGYRATLPDHLNPESIIREGREGGFDIDRDVYPA
jgi:plasmid stability protein